MTYNRFFYITTITFFVVVLGYLTYKIWKPFLSPIAWAIVLSIVVYPLYALLLKHLKWRSLVSLITLCLVMLIIIAPFSYLSFLLVKELKYISDYFETGGLEALQRSLQHPTIRSIIDLLTSMFNISEADLNNAVVNNISKLGEEIISRITKGLGDIVTVALNFIFMAFTIFFLLRDGPEFLKRARDYMPFSEEQKDRLTKQVNDIIISTIYGGVVVAIVQGTMGGLAFYFLGIPSPVIWGVAISIVSFIPFLGAFSIWGPATIYLFIQGNVINGIILAIIGVFGISLIDNILKPIIIGGRTKMPILAIFFSVLGGIKLFGLIGLIMGPLVLALLISVVEIFRNIEGGKNA